MSAEEFTNQEPQAAPAADCTTTAMAKRTMKESFSTWPFGRVLLNPAHSLQPSIMISSRKVQLIKRRTKTLMGTRVGARLVASASA